MCPTKVGADASKDIWFMDKRESQKVLVLELKKYVHYGGEHPEMFRLEKHINICEDSMWNKCLLPQPLGNERYASLMCVQVQMNNSS
mgnify:CR=1 FL=1